MALAGTEDTREAQLAFAEKRKPNWPGLVLGATVAEDAERLGLDLPGVGERVPDGRHRPPAVRVRVGHAEGVAGGAVPGQLGVDCRPAGLGVVLGLVLGKAVGITGQLTGSRADVVISDDNGIQSLAAIMGGTTSDAELTVQTSDGSVYAAKVVGTDRNGDTVEIEGTGFFARMLQHETGHLDGFLYTDVLTGRYARQAKKFIKKQGWNVPGLTWVPGTVEDPFGH